MKLPTKRRSLRYGAVSAAIALLCVLVFVPVQAASALDEPVITDVSKYAISVPSSVLTAAAEGVEIPGVTAAEYGAILANTVRFNSDWLTSEVGQATGGSFTSTPPDLEGLSPADQAAWAAMTGTFRGAPATAGTSLVADAAALGITGATGLVELIAGGLGSALIGAHLGAVADKMIGIDVDGTLCTEDADVGIAVQAVIIAAITSTNCDYWRMSQAFQAHLNADTATTTWLSSCNSSSVCIEYSGEVNNWHTWTVTGGAPAVYMFVVFPEGCGTPFCGGVDFTSVYANYGTAVAFPDSMVGSLPPICYSIMGSGADCEADESDVPASTTSISDPTREFACTVTFSDDTSVTRYSESFHESDGFIPTPVLPPVPQGEVAENISCVLTGGPSVIDVFVSNPTTDGYVSWADLFPECWNGSCLTDLRQDGITCLFQDIECDGWFDDPSRDSDYTCFIGTHLVGLEECYAYREVFNPAYRALGHAYADPATGDLTDGQTSPSRVDELTSVLLLRDWELWGPTPELGLVLGVGNEAEAARKVATQCVLLGIADDCEDYAIFAPGEDINEASEHDWDAITGTGGGPFDSSVPKSPLLHYREPSGRVSSGWYTGTPPCIPGTYSTSTSQCDEYPFRSTAEAGPGASLRVIDKEHNQKEGLFLGHFYIACDVDTEGAPFLTVPTPDLVATSEWCS